jgi:hypothetical protein
LKTISCSLPYFQSVTFSPHTVTINDYVIFFIGRKNLLQAWLSDGTGDKERTNFNRLPPIVEEYLTVQANHQRALLTAAWSEKERRVREEGKAGKANQSLLSLANERSKLESEVASLKTRVADLNDEYTQKCNELAEKCDALKSADSEICQLRAVASISDHSVDGLYDEVMETGGKRGRNIEVIEHGVPANIDQPESEELFNLRKQVTSHEGTLEKLRSAQETELKEVRNEVSRQAENLRNLRNAQKTTENMLNDSERMRKTLLKKLKKVSPQAYNDVVAQFRGTLLPGSDEEGTAPASFSEFRDSIGQVPFVPRSVMKRMSATLPTPKGPPVLSTLHGAPCFADPPPARSSVVRLSAQPHPGTVATGEIARRPHSQLQTVSTPPSPHTPDSTPPFRPNTNVHPGSSSFAQRDVLERVHHRKENEKRTATAIPSAELSVEDAPRRALDDNSQRTTNAVPSNVRLPRHAEDVQRSPSVEPLDNTAPSFSSKRARLNQTSQLFSSPPPLPVPHAERKKSVYDRSHPHSDKDRRSERRSSGRSRSRERPVDCHSKKYSDARSPDYRQRNTYQKKAR